jgi:hypothetical protein
MLYGEEKAEALESMREEVRQHEFDLQIATPTRRETLAAIDSVPPGLRSFFAAWGMAASERWMRAGNREYAETFLRIAAELREPSSRTALEPAKSAHRELQPCLASA